VPIYALPLRGSALSITASRLVFANLCKLGLGRIEAPLIKFSFHMNNATLVEDDDVPSQHPLTESTRVRRDERNLLVWTPEVSSKERRHSRRLVTIQPSRVSRGIGSATCQAVALTGGKWTAAGFHCSLMISNLQSRGCGVEVDECGCLRHPHFTQPKYRALHRLNHRIHTYVY
jgi:hypothetical protein